MEKISAASKSIMKMLAGFQEMETGNRLLTYCVDKPVEGGRLLFNMLTRELVLLTEEEWQNRFENEYLKEHWFVVPENCKDKEYADLVRWILSSKQPKKKNITGYTIFTTTDCNARCFYCFELGRSRIPMTEETAHKVATYIETHCGGETVNIQWYGGEPLFNRPVIDIICADLRNKGIEYKSTMISNGYLFDAETVRTAVEDWKLHRVQVALDGTETVYNKAKAYIYRQGNPFEIVLTNIGHLLDAGITVSIRLNMDMYNAENLLELVEELGRRYIDKERLSVYAYHIFNGNEPMATLHTEKEWDIRQEAMECLEQTIWRCGLMPQRGVSKSIKLNHCMADNGNMVTILPTGDIGLCDHADENDYIGHIDREGFDQTVVNSWKERIPEIPECAECFYYPDCVFLKKCGNLSICYEHLRRERRRKIERQMLNEYRMWKNREDIEQTDEDAIC